MILASSNCLYEGAGRWGDLRRVSAWTKGLWVLCSPLKPIIHYRQRMGEVLGLAEKRNYGF